MHFLYIGAAVIPALLILLYAYKQDSFPEPPRIVFKTFLFGCATVLGIDLIIPVLDNFSETTLKGETFNFFDNFLPNNPLPKVKRWQESSNLINNYTSNEKEIEKLKKNIQSWWLEHKENLKESFLKISDV